MSEIQNKAIALVVQNEGDLSPQSSPDRSRLFLKRALKLYFALGGDGATAAALVNEEQALPRSGVEPAIADVMIEIAAVSHLNDMDMIQAAYNRLDAELKAPR